MFLYRLKHEFLEQRILSSLWLLLLASYPLLAWLWWNSPIDDDSSIYSSLAGFGFLGSGIVLFKLVCSTINRDNLKNSQAFWTTRPVRPNTLFTAKWVYLQLITTLPIVIVTCLTAYNIDRSDLAGIAAMEYGLWSLGLTTLCACSCIISAKSRSMLHTAAFVVAIVLTILVVNLYIEPRWGAIRLSLSHSATANFLITLGLLSVTFTLLYFRQARNRHSKVNYRCMPVIGCVTTLLIIISPFPISSTTSQILTETTFKPEQTSSLSISGKGDTSGANYLNCSKEIALNDLLPTAERYSIIIEDLTIKGVSDELKPLLQLKTHIYSSNEFSKLNLSLRVYDRVPKSNNSNSSSSIKKNATLEKLPKKKLHVHGSLSVRADHFRDLEPSALTSDTNFTSQGVKIRGKLSRLNGLEVDLRSRNSRLPLMTSLETPLVHAPNVRVSHPSTNIDITGLDSSSRTSGMLGAVADYQHIVFDSISPDSYELKKLRAQGYTGTLEDWINEATQTISIYDHSTYYHLHIDMMVEVADPQLVHEYLINNN